MKEVFSQSEVVELGIQIEKNGRDFYNELTARTGNSDARDIYKYLAGEEEKHIAKFSEILDSIHQYEPSEAYPEEYFAYMNTLASQYVFTQKDKGSEIAKSTKSDMEAIDLGIKFEGDSITFYEGMKKVVPEKDHRILDELIAQEVSHKEKLIDLKEKL
jgi:rubrerythrin